MRIYPALLVLLLAGAILSSLFIPRAFLSDGNTRVGWWALYGLSNIALVIYHKDYFSPTNDYNPFAHTWSLGVEEQYYLIFPLVLFLILRAREKSPTARRAIGAILPVLFAASVLYSIRETSAHHDRAYYLLPSRFWELAVGALLCLAHHRGKLLPKTAGQSAWLTTVGLVVLIVSVVCVNAVDFPFPLAIPPVLGTALCIAGLVVPNPGGIAAKILTFAPVVGIGRISYSVYLWHWTIFVLLRWTVGLESISSYVVGLVLTFGLASASYFFLEAPIQRVHRSFKNRTAQVLITGLCVILTTHIIYSRITNLKAQRFLGLGVVTKNYKDWYPEPSWNHNRGPLFPGVAGKHWSDKRLFVIGDSHAEADGGLCRMLEENDGVSVLIDSFVGENLGSLVHPENANTEGLKQFALAHLKQYSRPGDVVLLASLRVHRLSEPWGELKPEYIAQVAAMETETNQALALRQGEELIRQLQQMNLTVIISAPMPVYKASPFRGSDWFDRMNPVNLPGFTVDRDFSLAHRAHAMEVIKQVQTDIPSVQVWDPFETFCAGTNCVAFDGSKPFFFDGDHLTDYGGRKLYPSFKEALEKIWR
jgi:peptidoglycan/LPS O-acetylase OafA/YrhL